jgi:hypothetical protein
VQHFFISHTIGPTDLLSILLLHHISTFPGTFDLLSQVTMCQHDTNRCSKCTYRVLYLPYVTTIHDKIYLFVLSLTSNFSVLNRSNPYLYSHAQSI